MIILHLVNIQIMIISQIQKNCTNNIDLIIPSLLIIPCGLSFLCLISVMVHTLIESFLNIK